jgi:hypothetical protein
MTKPRQIAGKINRIGDVYESRGRIDVHDPATGRLLAYATRCLKSDGFNFSGWVIRSEIDGAYSDPIGTKSEVMQYIGEYI